MGAPAMAALFRLLPLLTLGLALAGCVRVAADSAYPGPQPLPEALQAEFAYERLSATVSEAVLEEGPTYTKKRINLPSGHNILPGAHDIVIDYYQLKGEGKRPVVMVLPILGGGNAVAESFARYFAKHGFAVTLVHRQKKNHFADDLENADAKLRQIVFDHRQAIDWIESRPELDAGRIGVFGISMGGIKGALLHAIDQRIGASVLALVGGDLPSILTHSKDRAIAKRRAAYLQKHQLTPAQMQEQLAREIGNDPLYLAPHIDADQVLLILALFDGTIPLTQGLELREAMGTPETIFLFSGHYSAVLFKNYVKYRARTFFEWMLPER